MLDFSHGRARRRCTFLLKFLQLKCTTGKSALVIVNLSEYYLHKKPLRRCCTFFLAAASFSSRPVSAMYWFTTFCHIHKSFGASLLIQYQRPLRPVSQFATSMGWTAMCFTAYFFYLLHTAFNVNITTFFSLSFPLYWRLGARNSRHNETLRFTVSHLLCARGIRRSHFYSVISTKRLQVIG